MDANSGNTFIGLDVGTVGILNVTGAGSLMETDDLFVGGDSGTGTVTISGGGQILSGFRGILGNDPGGNGTVTVTGAGSLWDVNSSLSVGSFGGGIGSLTVSAGGRVTGLFATVGEEGATPTLPTASGIVTVTGADSVLETTSSLTVGGGGSGTVNVLSGAALTTGADSFIGRTASSSGIVTVSGSGAKWDSARNLYVGGTAASAGGPATLNMGSGATLLSGRDATHVLRVWGPGTLNLSGGTITAWDFQVTEGTFNWTSGTLEVKDTLTLDAGATGTGLVLSGSKVLRVAGPTNVGPGVPLTFDGANVSLTALTNSGIVQIKPAGLNQMMTSLTNQPSGLVLVSGSTLTTTSGISNLGEIRLEAGAVQVGASASLNNQGLIIGDGRINAALVNNAQGEVRALDAQRLTFTGASNVNNGVIHLNRATADFASTLTNQNQVDVLGGFLKVTGAATNTATGFIGGRDGVLRFTGGLTNAGSLGFTTGIVDLYGDVDNQAAGKIVVSGRGTATFYDDLVNNGSVQVSAGSTAVYFGGVSGTGSFLGTGTNFFEGDLRPGASPSIVNFAGDVEFGASSTLEIELGGLIPGTHHDQINVGGQARLNGTLDLVLINGFVPSVGDSFTIMTFGNRVGTFPSVTGTAVNPNLQLVPVYSATDLRLITAITGEKTWGVDAGGLFSVGSNWVGGVAPTGTSESVAFTTAISANRTVDVDIPASLISARFDDNNNYTLAGAGPIRFQAAGPAVANLTVQNTHGNGAHTINTPIEILGDLLITQDSTQPLTIGGPLDTIPARTITKAGAGTLVAHRVRAGALTLNAGSLVITPNGGNSGTSAVDNLSVNGTSRLDLNNNDLVVRATAATKNAVHGDIEADIVSAQNGLDVALVTKWDGPGLTSSTARMFNLAQGFDLTGIGVIRNSDLDVTTGIPNSSYTSFSGQAVTPDDVLVKYTYIGDANLSGAVSFDDYVGMDNAFFGLIPNLGWATGDINFDNVINFDDYSKVDQAFFFQGAPLSGEASHVAIPEPATWLFAVLAALSAVCFAAFRRKPRSIPAP